MLVIVADDDAFQRSFTSAVLARLGHQSLEVPDGEQALRAIRDTDAAILICDINMPGMDGLQVAREIRALKLERYVHIIIVTGRDQGEDGRLALEAGVDDFMVKPFDFATMTVRLRAAERLAKHEQILSERNRTLREAKERIESDLQAAAKAQRRLLPGTYGRVGDCEIHAEFQPSAIVSGDMFGYFELGPNRMGFYAIDVAGHGIHAALLSVSISHLITPEYFISHGIRSDGTPDLAGLLDTLNARFARDDSDEYFTMFCGLVDFESGKVTYAQAGYPSGLHINADGRCVTVGDGGFPVGLLQGVAYANAEIDFGINDCLFLCSDGAIEAENPAGEAFGENRIETIVRTAPRNAVALALTNALQDWRGGQSLEDDLTILTLHRILRP